MSDMNMSLNEEALPSIDESELVFGAKLAPLPEGTYAIRATLGKNGLKYDESKKTYTIHAENKVVKPLKYVSPFPTDAVVDEQKVFFNNDGTGKGIHDFFRISANNVPGIKKAVQFLKYAGDPDYNKYGSDAKLAKAVEEALKQEPDSLKLSGRWAASAEVGVDSTTGKKKYESVRGMKKFPVRPDGSISHVAEIDGEQVAAQFEVVEYGELTAKDAA